MLIRQRCAILLLPQSEASCKAITAWMIWQALARLGPVSQHIVDIRNDGASDANDSLGEDDAMIGTSIGYDVTSVGSIADNEHAATVRTSQRYGGSSSMGYAVSSVGASNWQDHEELEETPGGWVTSFP